MAYQSPIELEPCKYIKIHQTIDLHGRNEDAVFNSQTKNYEVQKKIIITVNKIKYRLHEYHFHNPSEHKVNGYIYPAEIHYVFIECAEDEVDKDPQKRYDICSCRETHDKNILVIGRTILDKQHYTDLKNLQVKVPHFYYEYDGTLTTGNYSPVRWIIGENPIHFHLNQIDTIAKTARPLQELNGRILLFSERK